MSIMVPDDRLKKKKSPQAIYLIAAIVCIALSACEPAAAPTPVPTWTVVTPSRTPIATSSLPMSFMPSKTERSVVPTETLEVHEATALAARATQIAPFLGCGCCLQYSSDWETMISPDGNWAFCESPVAMINRNGKKWTFLMGEFLGGEEAYGAYYVTPEFWTSDNNFLYFSPGAIIDYVIPPPYPIHYDLALLRWNLITGKVDTVLPVNLKKEYTLSISPTGRRLAYTLWTSPFVVVRDLSTGAEHSFQIDSKYDLVSDFSWSADGTELRYIVFGEGEFYLVKVDVRNNAMPVLYAITPEPTRTESP